MVIISTLLIALMLVVIWLDVSRFVIPNWLVGLVLLPWPVYFLISPVAIGAVGALGIAILAFAIGIGLFALKIMGGGDVKLLAACSLWVGTKAILPFVIYTSLLGGLLALVLLLGRPSFAFFWAKMLPKKPIPRVLEKGAPAPYGVAIAGAMIILILNHKIPALGIPL